MRRLVFALGLVCALARPAGAQTATVSGKVFDQSGAAVPGATVTLTGPAGSSTATSGGSGEYSFRNVASGTYRIAVTLPGFAAATRNDVVVGTANVEVPAITLSLASLTDTVVGSATKSEANLIDAPATMSVVTSEVL